MLVAIPPKHGASEFMGYPKGKGSLMTFDKHASLKHRLGNRKLWMEGCYASTVGLNEAMIAKCIREQEATDVALNKLSVEVGEPV